jgi:hypothetical protein
MTSIRDVVNGAAFAIDELVAPAFPATIDRVVLHPGQVVYYTGIDWVAPEPRRSRVEELGREVEHHLRNYIEHMRRRGRSPARLVFARPRYNAVEDSVEIHCRFADGWNTIIRTTPFLSGTIGADRESRAFVEEMCQRVYQGLLTGERTTREIDRAVELNRMRAELRGRIDRDIMQAMTTTEVQQGEPAALTLDSIRQAMAILEANPPMLYVDEFMVYGNAVYRPGAMFARFVDDGGPRPPRSRSDVEAASRRGLELLKSNLTPAQLEQYEREERFVVTGSASGRRYRIRYGDTFNVDELGADGEASQRLCFRPAGDLVIGDILLAQKIALETDETAALKVANFESAGRLDRNGRCGCPMCRGERPATVRVETVPEPARRRYLAADWIR